MAIHKKLRTWVMGIQGLVISALFFPVDAIYGNQIKSDDGVLISEAKINVYQLSNYELMDFIYRNKIFSLEDYAE